MTEPHINGINHHIAMIDVALPTLDERELGKLEEALIRIVRSAEMTLRDIKRQSRHDPEA